MPDPLLLASQQVTGVRIDHCDGMFNPRQYLIRLQLLYLASQCAGAVPQQETAANGIERSILDPVRGYDWSKSQGPLYTVVEKILEPREYLPPEWPVRGTSGYDFIYLANNIFIQSANEKRFNAIYAQVLGHPSDPDEIIYRSKLQVMQTSLASEVYVLDQPPQPDRGLEPAGPRLHRQYSGDGDPRDHRQLSCLPHLH